jgi:hypothetical protein
MCSVANLCVVCRQLYMDFIDKPWYTKEWYIHYVRELMLEDVRSFLRTSGDPYDVSATGSHQILAICTSLALGRTRGCWAVYAGICLETEEVVGATCWRWAVHASVWLKMEVLGLTRWRWVRDASVLVIHAGVRLKT